MSSTNYTDSGLEIWKYRHTASRNEAKSFAVAVLTLGLAGTAEANAKELAILFDENGVVKNFNMSESEEKIRTGVLK